jgi:hypothetical protein
LSSCPLVASARVIQSAITDSPVSGSVGLSEILPRPVATKEQRLFVYFLACSPWLFAGMGHG